MTSSQHSPSRASIRQIGPALLGAFSFACADVLIKVTFRAGADVLTASTLRGIVGLAFLMLWLRFAQKSASVPPRARRSALSLLGVFFAGAVFVVLAVGGGG